MMGPFKCRVYARECRAIADEAAEKDRAEALNMAAIWEDLARDHEDAGKRMKQQEAKPPRLRTQAKRSYG